jgi:hypothetical protein
LNFFCQSLTNTFMMEKTSILLFQCHGQKHGISFDLREKGKKGYFRGSTLPLFWFILIFGLCLLTPDFCLLAFGLFILLKPHAVEEEHLH